MKYASGNCAKYRGDDSQILISLYGPKGGTIALAAMTPGQAREFAASLNRAADEMESDNA